MHLTERLLSKWWNSFCGAFGPAFPGVFINNKKTQENPSLKASIVGTFQFLKIQTRKAQALKGAYQHNKIIYLIWKMSNI